MSLPNPSMTFTPFDPLPASDLNDLVENDQALAAGTGLDDSAVTTAKIADANVTAAKVNFGGAGTGIWWEEIGRTTLSGAGDTISVTGLPARKYLKIIAYAAATGGTAGIQLRLNNDSGANYARRTSTNSADATAVSSTVLINTSTAASGLAILLECEVVNVPTIVKYANAFATIDVTSGAGTAPTTNTTSTKWVNTTDSISRVDAINSGTGDFAIGSEVVVLGHN